MLERAWGFKSPLAHANEMAPDLGFSSPGWGSFASEVLEKVLSLAEVGGEAGVTGQKEWMALGVSSSYRPTRTLSRVLQRR